MSDLRHSEGSTGGDADAAVARVGGATEHAPTGAGHESRDVRIRPIVIAFVVLFVIAIVTHVLMYGVLYGFTAREERASEPASPLAATYGRQAPPAPRLQVAPAADLGRLRAREDTLLHDYAWADRGAGVVRIPIEHAIELLAARGLPNGATASAAAADGGGELRAGGDRQGRPEGSRAGEMPP